jgi:hypothetical protein
MATDFAGSLGCRRRRFRPAARRLAGGGRAGSARPGLRHLPRRAQDAAGRTQPHPLQAEEDHVPVLQLIVIYFTRLGRNK